MDSSTLLISWWTVICHVVMPRELGTADSALSEDKITLFGVGAEFADILT